MNTYQVILEAVGIETVMDECEADSYRFDPNPLPDYPAIITFTEAGGRQIGSYNGYWTKIKTVKK